METRSWSPVDLTKKNKFEARLYIAYSCSSHDDIHLKDRATESEERRDKRRGMKYTFATKETPVPR